MPIYSLSLSVWQPLSYFLNGSLSLSLSLSLSVCDYLSPSLIFTVNAYILSFTFCMTTTLSLSEWLSLSLSLSLWLPFSLSSIHCQCLYTLFHFLYDYHSLTFWMAGSLSLSLSLSLSVRDYLSPSHFLSIYYSYLIPTCTQMDDLKKLITMIILSKRLNSSIRPIDVTNRYYQSQSEWTWE